MNDISKQKQNITSELFEKLYQKVTSDVTITKITDAPGLTIVRNYDEKTEYFKDGKKMFIKVYLMNGFVEGTIDMVKEDSRFGGYTTVYYNKQYRKRFTNFNLRSEDGIIFDRNKKKFIIKDREFYINDFVELLVKNHTNNKLFLVRLKNLSKKIILKFIFWLLNDKYDWLKYHDNLNRELKQDSFKSEEPREKLKEVNIPEDPFFKYFKIHSNTLFIFITVLLVFMVILSYVYNFTFFQKPILLDKIFEFENFTVANPILLFFFFVYLSLLDYLTKFIISNTNNKKDGLIYKLHLSSLNNGFSLKLYKIKS